MCNCVAFLGKLVSAKPDDTCFFLHVSLREGYIALHLRELRCIASSVSVDREQSEDCSVFVIGLNATEIRWGRMEQRS